MDSDYRNAVFIQCLWTTNNALIFSPDICSLPCHVYTVVETPTPPQVVLNSLILYNNLPTKISTKISDLNFQANQVRAQLKKFTKMWTKAFVLLVVFYVYVKRKSRKKVFVDSMRQYVKTYKNVVFIYFASLIIKWIIMKYK